MEAVDTKLMARLNDMIDEATKEEEYRLAKALGELQIEIIEERTKAWEKGFDAGYQLGVRKDGLCRLVVTQPNK